MISYIQRGLRSSKNTFEIEYRSDDPERNYQNVYAIQKLVGQKLGFVYAQKSNSLTAGDS